MCAWIPSLPPSQEGPFLHPSSSSLPSPSRSDFLKTNQIQCPHPLTNWLQAGSIALLPHTPHTRVTKGSMLFSPADISSPLPIWLLRSIQHCSFHLVLDLLSPSCPWGDSATSVLPVLLCRIILFFALLTIDVQDGFLSPHCVHSRDYLIHSWGRTMSQTQRRIFLSPGQASPENIRSMCPPASLTSTLTMSQEHIKFNKFKTELFLKYSVSKWHHGLCCHSACVLPPQYHWDLLSPSQLPPPFARLPSSYSPPGRAGQPHPITCPLDVCTPNTLTYYFSS